MYKQLKDNNDRALAGLNADLGEWQIWDEAVRKVVYKLYLDKKLTQLTDYADAFKEISQGLLLVK